MNRVKLVLLTASIVLAMAFTQSFAQEKGSFTDARDKKTYKIVKIGEQTWMAENLNYNVKGSKCYDNKEANCKKYGRLYNWGTAMKSCPAGWHLPSKDEWEVLRNFVGGSETGGKHLKATSGWNKGGNGQDTHGFAALPGGGNSKGYFFEVGNRGYWWSSHEEFIYNTIAGCEEDCNTGPGALSMEMYYDNENARLYGSVESYLFSVRCIKDDAEWVRAKEKAKAEAEAAKPSAAEAAAAAAEAKAEAAAKAAEAKAEAAAKAMAIEAVRVADSIAAAEEQKAKRKTK